MRDPADTVTTASSAGPQAPAASPDRVGWLFDSISARPWDWSYFQALRLIECCFPGSPRLGTAARPADEPVRLGQEPSLSFAPASLAGLARSRDGRPARLSVCFLGLFGPNGPLPLHLTEYARNRVLHAGDASFARFADLIHHRFLSLFYRAWAQAQPCVSLDRPGQDRFAVFLGSLCGLGLESLRGRDAMPDHAKLHHAGLLARQIRNAEGLAALLTGLLGLSVEVEQFVGHWMALRERDHSRLGRSGWLGAGATLGHRVWDRQHKFRLLIGPLSLADYESLLPDSCGIEALLAAVRHYAGFEYEWDMRLILRAEEVPRLRLGGRQRLGYNCWLGRRSSDQAADDLVLDLAGHAGATVHAAAPGGHEDGALREDVNGHWFD
ncbi:MAG: type secretion system baseplate subunit TssG [Pseudomonadota bacterium]|jgi:type VI secretion system protein ImpH